MSSGWPTEAPEFWMDCHKGTESPGFCRSHLFVAWQSCWLVLELPARFHVIVW